MIKIFTDGSSLSNGKTNNTGGWGMAVFDEKDNLIYAQSGTSINTTNNREEFKAILSAIDYVLSMSNDEFAVNQAIICTDSSYCLNTLTDWMYRWERNNWIKSDKKVPENLDIIKPLYKKLSGKSSIEFLKVKGHSGLLGNELADALATGDEKKAAKIISTLKENNRVASNFVLSVDFL